MGRNKINIEPISNERSRQSTFAKRKNGLIKKAMELSILCKVEVTLLIVTGNKRLYEYSSNGNAKETFERFDSYERTQPPLTNANVGYLKRSFSPSILQTIFSTFSMKDMQKRNQRTQNYWTIHLLKNQHPQRLLRWIKKTPRT